MDSINIDLEDSMLHLIESRCPSSPAFEIQQNNKKERRVLFLAGIQQLILDSIWSESRQAGMLGLYWSWADAAARKAGGWGR